MRTNQTYRGITLVTASLSLIGVANSQVIRTFPFAPLHRTSVPLGNITMNSAAKTYTLTGRPGFLDCGNPNLGTQVEANTRLRWFPPTGSFAIQTMNFFKNGAAFVRGIVNPADTTASYITFSELGKKTAFGANLITQLNNQNTWHVPNGSSILANPVNTREVQSLACADIAINASMGLPNGTGPRNPYYILVDAAGNALTGIMCSNIPLPTPAGFTEARRLVLPPGRAQGLYNVLIFIQSHLVERLNAVSFKLTVSGSRGRTPLTPVNFVVGDANGDNVIDQIDEDICLAMHGPIGPGPDTSNLFQQGVGGPGRGYSSAELDYAEDGVVDLSDLVLIAMNNGRVGAPGWPKHQ